MTKVLTYLYILNDSKITIKDIPFCFALMEYTNCTNEAFNWFEIIQSMIILFTSLVIGSGLQEIFRPNFHRYNTIVIAFVPAFVFSVIHCGFGHTCAALFLHLILLFVFE